MSNPIFIPKRISLREAGISENQIEQKIAEDPSVFGFGELELKDRQRSQISAGRLDLLFQDSDGERRYEVEIQLGKTDESHIIRTIEYWDIERKRYPQYEHCAVIIAEEITSRFHNVISLFNRSIPLIAIQVNAYKINDSVALIFTTILDEFNNGFQDEDDDDVNEVTDRGYWIRTRGTEETVGMADIFLGIINQFSEGYKLKYTKFYIGLEKDGRANNFIAFRPRRVGINIDVHLPFSEEWERKIQESGLSDLYVDYHRHAGVYRFKVPNSGYIDSNTSNFIELFKEAYQNSI